MFKKIYFCTDGIFPYAIGGIQRHSRCLIEALASLEIDLTVLHPHSFKVFDHPRIQEVFIPAIREKKNYLLESYKYSRRVFDFLEDKNDGIVYAQGFTVWYGLKRLDIPVIVNPHGLESFQAIGFRDKIVGIPYKLIFSRIFRHADFVISEGGKLTNILSRILQGKGKIITFYNGVTPPSIPTKRSFGMPRKFLFVGRFVHNKGLHILFRVFERLPAEVMQNTHFTLAGSGPLLEYFKVVNKWSNVEITGFIDETTLHDHYINSHVFLLPTLFEGMPTVVLEAMGKCLPIIVSDVGGTSVMVDAMNGFLLDPGNEQQLINAIVRAFKASQEELQQMGITSFKRVSDNHNWNSIALQHKTFFESIGL
jgi:glycosyltransferase involved in cell wall biosynthesis